jgi:hypothetical protein
MPSGETISNVDHDSPLMIFCGGSNGQLFHFDGSRWNVDTIKNASVDYWPIYVTVAGTTSDNGALIQTTQYDTTTGHIYYQFLNYKDKQITNIGSSIDHADWGGESFWKSKEGNIFSCGWNGVWRLTGTKWTQVKESFQYVSSIYGVDERHMFAAERTNFYYYDGSSWTQLDTKFSITFNGAKIWCTSHEVFVAFTDGIRTYILHGK